MNLSVLSLAVTAVRGRWHAFAGILAALALGVGIVATMALVLGAAGAGGVQQSPSRFGAVPFVITAEPSLVVRDRYGSLDKVPFPSQPAVPASAVARFTGAARPDRSFFAQVLGAQTGGLPALGHGWSSAAFAPYRLVSGHAPAGADQIVVAGRAVLGSRVRVLTAAGAQQYTIVGTVGARPGEWPVFFTDAQAARLSPSADALATWSAATARAAAAVPGLQVLTGQARHQADPLAAQDTAELTGLTSFLGVAALLAGFVMVGVTGASFGLSVAQRRRDIALLRVVGATPRQVMRMVYAEALLVGATGSAAGCLLGVAAAPALARWMADQGLAPSWFSVGASAAPLVIAFAAGIAVAALSVTVAAMRAGSIRPVQALREAAVEPRRLGRWRRAAGVLALACGAGMLLVVAVVFPADATDLQTQAMAALLLIGGATLLAPFLVRSVSRLPMAGTAGTLVQASLRTQPRRAAAASSAAVRDQAVGASYVVLPADAPGLTTALAESVDAGVPATAVTDTTVLAYEPAIAPFGFHLEAPMPIPFPAIGIDHPSAAFGVPVRQGSLAGLSDDTVAVDTSWGLHVGSTLRLWLADGTPVALKVIAVYSSGLSGTSLILDQHNAGGLPDRAYVRATPAWATAMRAAAGAEGARIVPAARWSAAVSGEQAAQNQAGLVILVGIAVLYCAIGIASTFGMSTRGRRSEWALLNLSGATRRQVIRVIVAEALALTLTGIVVAAVTSAVVLGLDAIALARAAGAAGAAGVVVPWTTLAAITGATVLIGVVAAVLPASRQFRSSVRSVTG
ncbi:MAG TPA: ABC transporter permease [Streptosporangiaceae bacterium]|nr:ABC transporter permease [Streptosporangiaceae bacterium]